jgi:hypothetical protein
MRHLWSFLAGLVSAPLAWVLITLGQDGSSRTVTHWVEVGTFTTANLIEPTVYLGVAGIVLGLLGTLRVSPLGPLVAGLLLVGPYVGLFVDPFALRNRLPDDWRIFGDRLPLVQPVQNGTLFLLGVLLLMATFSARRWQRWPTSADAGAPPPPESPADDETPTTDWSALTADLPDRDTSPPTLGYPTPATPAPPLPRRDEASAHESPWSAPPRTGTQRETTAD